MVYNGSGIVEGGEFQHYFLIGLQMLNYFRQPHSIAAAPPLASIHVNALDYLT
jgi:hypothetical protein